MNKYVLPISTLILAIIGVTSASITGAAVFDRAEYCVNSMVRGCYELDAGPFNLERLPPQARVNDTFRLNPKAGPNKWVACERTNADSIIESEFETDYCGVNAVEKVKSCNMGESNVVMYYYTGECRALGVNICDDMFTIPKDCVSSAAETRDLIVSLNQQVYEDSLDYPLVYSYGRCYVYPAAQVYGKQEIRRVSSSPIIQYETTYYWIYSLNESCVEGDPVNADSKIQRRVGDILIDTRVMNDLALSIMGRDWKYSLRLTGCSDFTQVYDLRANDNLVLACQASDYYFCGCSTTPPVIT